MVTQTDGPKRLDKMVEFQSFSDYITMLKSNKLNNDNITIEDMTIANKIYKSIISLLYVKPMTYIIPVLDDISNIYHHVIICADILFTDKVICFSTISRKNIVRHNTIHQ